MVHELNPLAALLPIYKIILGITGSEALGGALMSFFFVTIGAAAGSLSAVFSTGWLLVFIAVQLSVHMAVTIGLGALLGLPTQVICSKLPTPALKQMHYLGKRRHL